MKKTPLQRKTALKAKSGIKAYTPLRAKTELRGKAQLKQKQKGAKKLPGQYFSIFTSDLGRCVITGNTENVVVHHIFGGAYKTLSEKYGFVIPLRSDWHTISSYSIHQDRELNLQYKIACQEYYIRVLQKTKEDWLTEFQKWWVKENEKCS